MVDLLHHGRDAKERGTRARSGHEGRRPVRVVKELAVAAKVVVAEEVVTAGDVRDASGDRNGHIRSRVRRRDGAALRRARLHARFEARGRVDRRVEAAALDHRVEARDDLDRRVDSARPCVEPCVGFRGAGCVVTRGRAVVQRRGVGGCAVRARASEAGGHRGRTGQNDSKPGESSEQGSPPT